MSIALSLRWRRALALTAMKIQTAAPANPAFAVSIHDWLNGFLQIGRVHIRSCAERRAAIPTKREDFMNWDQIEGKWKQVSGNFREKWGRLTDDDLIAINGRRDQLVGKVQERYGLAKEAAEKQVDEFIRTFNSSN